MKIQFVTGAIKFATILSGSGVLTQQLLLFPGAGEMEEAALVPFMDRSLRLSPADSLPE